MVAAVLSGVVGKWGLSDASAAFALKFGSRQSWGGLWNGSIGEIPTEIKNSARAAYCILSCHAIDSGSRE